MAEGTRMQAIEKQLLSNEARFGLTDDHQQLVEADLHQLRDPVGGLKDQMLMIDKQIQALLESNERMERLQRSARADSPPTMASPSRGILPRPPTDPGGSIGDPVSRGGDCAAVVPDPTILRPSDASSNPSMGGMYKTPRIDFPPFDGTEVRVWVQKATRFFQLNPMPDRQTILLAALYFKGKDENWYQADTVGLEGLSWLEFTEQVKMRFYEEICENVNGEFNRLVQTSSLQAYLERFKELYPLMLLRNKGLT
ncbi:hypothetical protein ACHQM5_025592 [Ranunculus cassubicifolius]